MPEFAVKVGALGVTISLTAQEEDSNGDPTPLDVSSNTLMTMKLVRRDSGDAESSLGECTLPGGTGVLEFETDTATSVFTDEGVYAARVLLKIGDWQDHTDAYLFRVEAR